MSAFVLSRARAVPSLATARQSALAALSCSQAAPTSVIQARTFATKPLFDKILIANRGEIAVRVMKTCKRLGIRTVAVYSEPDANSKHVQWADEAYCVGPASTTESYLRQENILEACKKSGAQAVHPGYGFLSERSAFCDLLESNGIAFIGPKKHSLEQMGLKIESKKIAIAAGVNTIPGFAGSVDTDTDAVRIAKQIGYPVMIKASAGGGGKGMRVCWNDKDVIDGFRFSRAEARKSFAMDTLLVEKFIVDPRHIEIQLLGDRFGNAVYLNERECSIQRRNQKIIEEAPSTFVTPALRKEMGEQAVRLAKAVKYESAGTCEFLVDKDRNFYFLEMNTRLQVEHPITEAITGFDLVEHMIRIAAGEQLSIKQEDVGINGWALETRVYAEDPLRSFLPSIGHLTRYVEPTGPQFPETRCDSGILEGSEISMHYDPLICKLVTHGPNRDDALAKMRRALDAYVIRGVTHNVNFLRAICDHPRFIKGDINTHFIPDEYPEGFKGNAFTQESKHALLASMVAIHAAHIDRDIGISDQLPLFNPQKFRAQELGEHIISFQGQDYHVSLHPDGAAPAVDADGGKYRHAFKLNIRPASDQSGAETDPVTVYSNYTQGDLLCETKVNNKPYVLQIFSQKPFHYRVQHEGTLVDVMLRSPREEHFLSLMPAVEVADYSRFVVSPMPGAVASVAVKAGDTVLEGQEVCVVEAMKMQNALYAPKSGKIKTVMIKQGETVAADQLLVEFE